MENLADRDAARALLIRKTSHDVRTPLTSIAGFADLIAEDTNVPENAREFALLISAESKRLSGTLERFFEEIRTDIADD